MADFSALKTAIQTYIKQNGNEEITGEILQEILLSVVTTLGDSAINDLVTALANEVAARQNADSSLEGAINQEGTLRSNADSTLQGNINAEATARANGDTALSNRLGSSITAENTAADQISAEAEARETADTALQGLIDGITDNIENGYVYAGIATPSSTPATGKVFYLALTAGTYTNFGSTVVSQGINILKYNGSAWSLDAFIGIDDELTAGSNNLPKSGNVLENIIKNGSAFDLSAYNAVDGVLATYAGLDAALTALNALPAVYKQGGMSFKFVQSSDNKYVQFRCMSQSFTTDVTHWQGVEEEPISGSRNLVSSGGVFYGLLACSKTVQSVKMGTNGVNFKTYLKPTHEYYLQYVSGDSGFIYVETDGNNGKTLSEVGKWVKFTTTTGGRLVGYIPNVANPPIIRIADSDSFIKEILEIKTNAQTFETATNNKFDELSLKTIMTMDTHFGTVSWIYDYKLVAGKKYYVKWVAGYNSNFYTTENDAITLGSNWKLFTPDRSAKPESYGGQGEDAPQVEIVAEDSELIKEIFPLIEDIKTKENKIKETTIICNRIGDASNDDSTHFYGLNAITKALNSITNASYYNRYIIKIVGHFLFTNPSDITPSLGGEYAPIISKNWVSFEGVDKTKSSIEVRFDANTVFPSGKSYNDYQPVYINWWVDGNPSLKNLTIIGENCRYIVHIEQNSESYAGTKLTIEDCDLINMGNDAGGIGNIFGTGGGINFDWDIKNCKTFSKGSNVVNFAYHTCLNAIQNDAIKNSTIVFDSCDFNARRFAWEIHGYNRRDRFVFKNTNLNNPYMNGAVSSVSSSRKKLGIVPEITADFKSIPFGISIYNAKGLKITSNVVGDVVIDETSSAFAIFGNSNDTEKYETDWGAIYEYGYEHKTSTVISGGYAQSYINVDAGTGGLKGILGDCSSESKVLSLTIGTNNIDIVFNENYTGKTNDYIIGVINTALGEYGTASLDSPEKNMFPLFNSVTKGLVNGTNDIIRKGMGVIISSSSTLRLATRNDGYIDGVALDEIFPSQKGRVICDGILHTASGDSNLHLNNIYHSISTLQSGDVLSISETNAGEFVKSDTKPVMRVIGSYAKFI